MGAVARTAAYRDSVTLEGETELRAPVRGDGLVAPCRLCFGGLFAEVLDAHATLDGPYREALLVREDRHASTDEKTRKTTDDGRTYPVFARHRVVSSLYDNCPLKSKQPTGNTGIARGILAISPAKSPQTTPLCLPPAPFLRRNPIPQKQRVGFPLSPLQGVEQAPSLYCTTAMNAS